MDTNKFYEFTPSTAPGTILVYVNVLDIGYISVSDPATTDGTHYGLTLVSGSSTGLGGGTQLFDTEADARAAAALWRDRAETAK